MRQAPDILTLPANGHSREGGNPFRGITARHPAQAGLKGITAKSFFALEKYIIESGLGSDLSSFEEIKRRLITPPLLFPDDFAREVFYVILASGFSQTTAKRVWAEICEALPKGEDITLLFRNKNKTSAIIKVWENRQKYRDDFYAKTTAEDKVAYLATLPHIGKITCNHLARNLGISIVKYDVWIQRLGIAAAGLDAEPAFPLPEKIRKACDSMFAKLEGETGLPRGYIDVVLWKACQQKLIVIP